LVYSALSIDVLNDMTSRYSVPLFQLLESSVALVFCITLKSLMQQYPQDFHNIFQ